MHRSVVVRSNNYIYVHVAFLSQNARVQWTVWAYITLYKITVKSEKLPCRPLTSNILYIYTFIGVCLLLYICIYSRYSVWLFSFQTCVHKTCRLKMFHVQLLRYYFLNFMQKEKKKKRNRDKYKTNIMLLLMKSLSFS